MPDNDNTQNGEIIEQFVLPRLDWYDEEGRIYKDALIENFNAIETKLLQISRLSAFQKELPNISAIDFPDVTLDDEENRIINLKSFLEMTDIIGYPLELTTSGKTIKKICYWGDDHNYHQLLNKTIDITGSRRFVYLNYHDNEVIASGESESPENCVLIGYYIDNTIKHINSYEYGGINLLYYLSKMNIETLDVTMENSEQFRDHGVDTGHNLNGATVGGTDLDTGSGSNLGTVRFNRIGRTSA